MEYYLYLKALHLIFVITWFAGLFYLPRLFIYHIEAQQKPEPENAILSKQLKLMQKRLWYIITWPSAVLCTLFALWLLILQPAFLTQGWMHIKLSFVLLLWLYHLYNHRIYKQLQKDIFNWSSMRMRLWNEVATILLFAIVFLVILRNQLGWIFGVLGIIGLGALLAILTKWYKNYRKKNPKA